MDRRTFRNSVHSSKRILNALRGKDIWQSVQTPCCAISLGNVGACWSICPKLLANDSVVYSLGVGEDISFDLQLIDRFKLQVYAFDPTPRSIEWVQSQNVPSAFKFYGYGIAPYDGTAEFDPPINPTHVSHTMLRKSTASLYLPVRRLQTVMATLKHSSIDLLKMDIEGAEYSVLDDFLTSRIPVKQLLVEFHHRWEEIGIRKTILAIQSLNNAGYTIFHISPTGEEYSFRKLSLA